MVKDALAAIEQGGYAEAVARVGALLAPAMGKPLPLERLHLRRELIDDYRALLPETAPDEQRRIRGEQDIIVRYEPRTRRGDAARTSSGAPPTGNGC